MKIDDLPPNLRKAVKEHIPLAVDNGYDTSFGARGYCLEASDQFLHTLKDHGFIPTGDEEFLRHYIFAPNTKEEILEQKNDVYISKLPFNVPSGCMYHFAVKVGDIVIDWTARQFGERNPFPAIWREP